MRCVVAEGFDGEEVVGELVARADHRAQTPPVPIENRHQRGIVELLESVLGPEVIRLNGGERGNHADIPPVVAADFGKMLGQCRPQKRRQPLLDPDVQHLRIVF